MWSADFKAVTERRYLPPRGVPPFAATALCRVPVGKRRIEPGQTVPVQEVIVQENRDGWQKVGYVVTVGRYTVAVPATKFVVGDQGECPNQSDLGTYMVDWTYGDSAPYASKGKAR